MQVDPVRILLIEDNYGDARLIHEQLQNGAGDTPPIIVHESRLADGLARQQKEEFDVLLLDLGLPDTQGLETLERCVEQAVPIPIVVLTQANNERLGEAALRTGAQDYMAKDTIEPRALMRAIRYAQARFELLQHERDLLKREVRMLARTAAESRIPVTARSFGAGPLRESSQMVFRELSEQYGRVLDDAVDARSYKRTLDQSEVLRALADTVGFLGGGPRDVVDLHVNALETRVQGAPPTRARVYVEEGRLLVLKLMGEVLSFYRTNAVIGGNQPREAASALRPTEEQEPQ